MFERVCARLRVSVYSVHCVSARVVCLGVSVCVCARVRACAFAFASASASLFVVVFALAFVVFALPFSRI